MSSRRPGDVLETNFWTSRNGHFAAWDVTNSMEYIAFMQSNAIVELKLDLYLITMLGSL